MSESANVATMPKRSHVAPLSKVKSLQEAFDHPEFMRRIKQSLPKHMPPERMLRLFVQCVQKQPKLMRADLMSVLGAFLTVSSVGLEPNTALQHAHIIPFEKKKWNPQTRQRELERIDVNIIFGYPGLLELSYRSGLVASIHADVVWRGDEFDYWHGTGGQLKHKPMGGARAENEMPLWAYSYASLKGGAEGYEVMPWSDVLAVRDATQAYQSAVYAFDEANKKGWKPPASYTEAPWVKHIVPMAKKTAFRQHSKWLPKSIELAAAVALDEAAERGAANYAQVIEDADFLETGIDEMTSAPAEIMDAGAAHGVREQEAQERPAGQVPRSAAPREDAKPAARPAFSAHLIDEFGEYDQTGPYADAARWVAAFGDAWSRCSDRDMLVENNGPTIEEVEQLGGAPAQQLAAILESAAIEGRAIDLTGAVPIEKDDRGMVQFGPYFEALRASLARLGPENVAAWVANNDPVYAAFPKAKALEAAKLLALRCEELKTPAPRLSPPVTATKPAASATDAAPPADALAAPADDKDVRQAEQFMQDIRAKASHDELRVYDANLAFRTPMNRWRETRPELFERVQRAMADQLQSFGPPPDDDDKSWQRMGA